MSKKVYSVLVIGIIITSFLVLSNEKINSKAFVDENNETEISPQNIMFPIYRYYDVAVGKTYGTSYTFLLLISGIEVWPEGTFYCENTYIGNETYNKLLFNNSFLYILTLSGFQILNFSDSFHMQLQSDYNVNSTKTVLSNSFFLNGTYLYLTYLETVTREFYLEVINVENKTNPILETKYKIEEKMGDFYSISVQNQYVYLLYEHGLFFYNFENFSNPLYISYFNMSISGISNPFYSITFKDNYTLIGSQNGLVILDLSNISDVTLHRHFTDEKFYYINEIFLGEEYVFITTSYGKNIIAIDMDNFQDFEILSVFTPKVPFARSVYSFFKIVESDLSSNMIHAIRTADYAERCYYEISFKNPNKPEQLFPGGYLFFDSDINELILKSCLITGLPITVALILITVFMRRKIRKLGKQISESN
ncbi:MAG: hypothetical protein GNW80_02615 [Asgard group archaeon]|nr:hypothetical protein [Asgard group archaeon]